MSFELISRGLFRRLVSRWGSASGRMSHFACKWTKLASFGDLTALVCPTSGRQAVAVLLAESVGHQSCTLPSQRSKRRRRDQIVARVWVEWVVASSRLGGVSNVRINWQRMMDTLSSCWHRAPLSGMSAGFLLPVVGVGIFGVLFSTRGKFHVDLAGPCGIVPLDF